jgi:hypothetical protein
VPVLAGQTRERPAAVATRVDDGPEGNGRLTAAAAVVLLPLLAVEGVTLLALRRLLPVHLFVGALLLSPVALKLASTGYRFARYYTRAHAYRLKGPPPAALRMIAPIVVVTTVVMFASGVALMVAGPSYRDSLLPIHKVSFVVWLVFTAVHVLGHLLELPAPVRADLGPEAGVAGRSLRLMLVVLAIGGGVALGLWALTYAGPWQGTFSGH